MVPDIRLRPVRADDLDALVDSSREENPLGFYGHRATNSLARQFAADGLISEDAGGLTVETPDGAVAGSVDWRAVFHGPGTVGRALNIGIHLRLEHRGRGYGTAAQAALARYLFETTLIERLAATTDVENLAEQRALTKAGFQREGIVRHGQFRLGRWRDVVLYSRPRGDPDPADAPG